MGRNYGMHRIQTAEAQFSSVDFLFLMHCFHFKRDNFTNTNLKFTKITLTRARKTHKRSTNNPFPP